MDLVYRTTACITLHLRSPEWGLRISIAFLEETLESKNLHFFLEKKSNRRRGSYGEVCLVKEKSS